ncbi:hypothetical protein CTEN210_17928 [Chaetoceros tenuissimus]|uniref:Uncharacterized protein n=1 Tax=Chaetoceros tenuissimus TaxID=426638 RepID=A0AAD3DBG9_9STRA|nr:hypothetical protein CTEN210_17928 [Chaetoceros tenuissimus]
MAFAISWKLTALAIVCAISQRSVDAFVSSQRPITTNQQHQQRPNSGSELYVEQRVSYTKGAEIFPPCNQKEFTLADSFPEGLIPEAAKFILEQKEPSILQQIESAALDSNDCSRRDFVKVAAAVVALPAVATLSQSEFMNGISKQGNTMTLSQAIDWIENNCDKRFIHAVVASDYNFLYYGLDKNAKESIRVESLQKSDLLDFETYGSNDVLEYFQNLESLLVNDVVKPSNGHLMTTSSKDAANWGTAYSMWPMGDVHYAWFQSKGLFYPRSSIAALTRDDIIVDGRDCGKDSLDDALTTNGCEVLVSGQRYMAVPASMDNELRQALKNAFLI